MPLKQKLADEFLEFVVVFLLFFLMRVQGVYACWFVVCKYLLLSRLAKIRVEKDFRIFRWFRCSDISTFGLSEVFRLFHLR